MKLENPSSDSDDLINKHTHTHTNTHLLPSPLLSSPPLFMCFLSLASLPASGLLFCHRSPSVFSFPLPSPIFFFTLFLSFFPFCSSVLLSSFPLLSLPSGWKSTTAAESMWREQELHQHSAVCVCVCLFTTPCYCFTERIMKAPSSSSQQVQRY